MSNPGPSLKEIEGNLLYIDEGGNLVLDTIGKTNGQIQSGSLPQFIVKGGGPPSGSITVTDGSTTVAGVTEVTFDGSTVSGATPDATVTASGGGRQITGAAIIANAQLGATSLPANAFILGVLLRETAGHAVSISLGTTSGASDVLAAVSVAASSGLYIDGASLAASWFSAGATQAIFVTSAAWGGASINAALLYQVGQ